MEARVESRRPAPSIAATNARVTLNPKSREGGGWGAVRGRLSSFSQRAAREETVRSRVIRGDCLHHGRGANARESCLADIGGAPTTRSFVSSCLSAPLSPEPLDAPLFHRVEIRTAHLPPRVAARKSRRRRRDAVNARNVFFSLLLFAIRAFARVRGRRANVDHHRFRRRRSRALGLALPAGTDGKNDEIFDRCRGATVRPPSAFSLFQNGSYARR